jgi:hypothetical protein
MDTEQLVNRIDDAVAALEDLAVAAGRIALALEQLVDEAEGRMNERLPRNQPPRSP